MINSELSSLCLTEEDVGISEYVGDSKGFFGIIKQRFSDFIVNEINCEGTELHLTDLKTYLKLPSLDGNSAQNQNMEMERPTEISTDVIAGLEALLASRGTDQAADPVLVPVSDVSKERRTAVHKFLNKAYKGLISTTVDQSGLKFIKVTLGSEQSLKIDNKRRTPQHLRHCLRFLLYKENMDTMEAAGKLAAKLRVNVNRICYAGTKDRRAKTVQLMSLYDIPPERLVKAVKCIPRMMVGNLHYHRQPLALGQLSGNAFTIVLREVKGDDVVIDAAVETLGRVGAINYYGMQRFGSRAGQTHVVGRHLLLEQWDQAVKTILKPDTSQCGKSRVLREYQAKELSAAEAVQRLEECRARGHEHCLLKGLAELGPSDMLGALNRLQRNMRNLYLHAYQSYLWNKVVSMRIKKYGLAVLPGDLVPTSALQRPGDEFALPDDTESTPAPGDEVASKKLVRRLEEREVSSTTVYQVLIPCVGHCIMMPENEITQWYNELLAADGLAMSSFKSPRRGHGVCGAYRAMLLVPQNLSHRICHYTDPLLPLVPSDADKFRSSENVECPTKPSSPKGHISSRNDALSSTKHCKSTEEAVRHSCSSVNASQEVAENPFPSQTESHEMDSAESGVSENTGITSTAHHVENVAKDTESKARCEDEKDESVGAAAAEVCPNRSGSIDAQPTNCSSPCNGESSGSRRVDPDSSVPEQSCPEKVKSVCEVEGQKEMEGQVFENAASESGNLNLKGGESKKAVILQFSLPPAAYATMVLRQLLRMETGSQFHASLNTNSAVTSLKRPMCDAQDSEGESREKNSALHDRVAARHEAPQLKKPKVSDCGPV